jgi:hypothetical protein
MNAGKKFALLKQGNQNLPNRSSRVEDSMFFLLRKAA